jgi:hypothetical protein
MQADNLGAVRHAFGAVREDRRTIRELRGITGGASPPYRTDSQALRQTLQAGDLAASRAAFATLGQDWSALRRLEAVRASDAASGVTLASQHHGS